MHDIDAILDRMREAIPNGPVRIKEATEAGFVNVKGHRNVGGMRASIYNAMPMEGARALADFMREFEIRNK